MLRGSEIRVGVNSSTVRLKGVTSLTGISERWQAVAILMCGQVEPVTFHTMAAPLWGVHLDRVSLTVFKTFFIFFNFIGV